MRAPFEMLKENDEVRVIQQWDGKELHVHVLKPVKVAVLRSKLRSMIAENEGLDMLSLSETGLNATGAKALADGLRTNPHMENLYLDGNEIGDEGAAALASALGADSRLDGSGFAPSLSGNVSGVKRLYLMRNEIGNAGGEALAELLNRAVRGHGHVAGRVPLFGKHARVVRPRSIVVVATREMPRSRSSARTRRSDCFRPRSAECHVTRLCKRSASWRCSGNEAFLASRRRRSSWAARRAGPSPFPWPRARRRGATRASLPKSAIRPATWPCPPTARFRSCASASPPAPWL